MYYEVRIHYDGFEYEFDFDKTGKLLNKDVEKMDRDDMYDDDDDDDDDDD